MKFISGLIAFVLATLASLPASADHFIMLYASKAIRYNQSQITCMNVPKIPRSLGFIHGIQVDLSLNHRWGFGIENTSSQSNMGFVADNATHTLELFNPVDGSTIVGTTVNFTPVQDLIPSTFDGTIDFQGASGRTYSQTLGPTYSCEMYDASNNPELMNLLTGVGTVCLPFRTTPNSVTVHAGGNTVSNSQMREEGRLVMSIMVQVPDSTDGGGGQIP